MKKLITGLFLVISGYAVAQTNDSALIKKEIHSANIYVGPHSTQLIQGYVVLTYHMDLVRKKWIYVEGIDPVIALMADKKTIIRPPFEFVKKD